MSRLFDAYVSMLFDVYVCLGCSMRMWREFCQGYLVGFVRNKFAKTISQYKLVLLIVFRTLNVDSKDEI